VTPPDRFDVLTVGEAMVLLAAREAGALEDIVDFTRYSAGAELNVAIGLARLGLRVGYLSRLGADAFGRFLSGVLSQEDIGSGLVAVDPARSTGFMLKSRAADGADPVIDYYRRQSAASAMDVGDFARLDGREARHVHLTGITPALSAGCHELALVLLTRARTWGARVSFDPNLRPRLWASREEMVATVNAFAFRSDVVLPGLAEGRVLTGCERAEDIADFYLARGAGAVVVKLGATGAWCADQAGLRARVPGVAVANVVDTVGAGDGFAVGVISGLLEGVPLAGAARRGNVIGARVVQYPGDSDGLPDAGELAAAELATS
jgi:2-dehydro-3-deoxygluconokinase